MSVGSTDALARGHDRYALRQRRAQLGHLDVMRALVVTPGVNNSAALVNVPVSSGGRTIALDAGALNRSMVLENNVVFGSVNANRRHYELAVESLSRAHRDWLARLITRREPLAHYARALRKEKGDIKVCLEVAS